jgi:UDP-N-acetylglucosamine 4-epimerase
MSHQAPVINGDGSVSRDFTYIDNVIRANHLAALTANTEAVNQVFNVAHGERTSLNELFRMIRRIAGEYDSSILAIEPVYGPVRNGDIPHSLASVEKAGRLLGYAPVMNVEQGLEEAVRWFRENL